MKYNCSPKHPLLPDHRADVSDIPHLHEAPRHMTPTDATTTSLTSDSATSPFVRDAGCGLTGVYVSVSPLEMVIASSE